ncbi:MAG: hypothetical protein H6737_04300 [Alphaproteobacteria bacterium]|nr:hypothetical protein [Alphaproteobacteria bacterium]
MPGSSISALSSAAERMVAILFRPFDLAKYVLFALFAWLANCSSPDASFQTSSSEEGGGMQDIAGLLSDSPAAAGATAGAVVALAMAALVAFLLVWAIATFLSSRGTFMLIHGIATNDARLEHWNTVAHRADALAWFRFRLGAALFGLGWLGAVGIALMGIGSMAVDEPGAWVPGAAAIAAVLGPILLLGMVLDFFVRELAAPVMYVEEEGVLHALGSVREADGFGLLGLVEFLFVRLLLGTAISVLTVMVSCLLFCLMLLPGMSAVVFLPLTVLARAYSMHWVADLDPRFAALREP